MKVKCITSHEQTIGPGRFMRYVKGREYEKISGMASVYFEPVKVQADTSAPVPEKKKSIKKYKGEPRP